MKDYFGNEIVKNCYIIYLDVYKNNIYPAPGKVIDVDYDNKILICQIQSRDRQSKISNLNKVLVISKEKYLELITR